MSTRGMRLYGLALRLLPRAMRSRHGEEMMVAADRELAAARERGVTACLGVWLRLVADVIGRAAYERRRVTHRYDHGRRRVWMMGADVRAAVRGIVREPGMTVLIVAMLGLGIAANTAVFSLVNGLYLRPLPFPESDRLVYLNQTAPRWNLEYTGINYPDFDGWRQRVRQFEGMALYDGVSFNLSDADGAERVEGLAVTHDFAGVLGLEPIVGRTFTEEEDRPNGPRVALLGWRFWQTRFGGERDVAGRTIRLDGESVTIVGVLPREAIFPRPADLWVPLAGDPAQPWESYAFEGVGRLRGGVGLEQAALDLDQAHGPIWEARDTSRTVSPRIEDLREHYVGEYRSMSLALAGSVALVLLIACANVASVLLARASARRKEIGIRITLGAGGWQVSRQLLTESLMLSLMAGGLGLLLGQWGARILVGAVPDQLPQWATFGLDWRIVTFSLVASTITALLFGWAPMLQVKRASLASVLSAGSIRTTATASGRRTLNGLVVAEVALALVLLVGGGLLLVAFQRLRAVDPGFRTENVLSFRIALPPSLSESETDEASPGVLFYDGLLERVRGLPGVQAAGAITCPPLTCHQGQFVTAEGAPPPVAGESDPVILIRTATPGYFEAMGIAVIRGRSFVGSDGANPEAGVVIVNEMLASQLWPGLPDPVGRRLKFRGSEHPWMTVVGVARNVKHYGLDEPSRPGLYLPLRQNPRSSLAILVHTIGNPVALAPSVRTLVRELDADLPVFQLGSMSSSLAQSMALRRTFSRFLAVFAIVALMLAAGGLYGVVSYSVTQRTKEIGIRVALGARSNQLVRMVLSQGMALVGLGLFIGMLGAMLASRLVSSLLFGVESGDPRVFSMAIGTLALTAGVANFIPAWRAARLDPQTALREESS